jgi:hypothetical protein
MPHAVEIGRLVEGGASLRLDVPRLVATRLLVQGRSGEITLSEAAEKVRKEAGWYSSAGGSLARLAGRLRAHANRQLRV